MESVEVPKDYHKLWKWATGIGYIDYDTGEILTGDYELPKWVEALAGRIIPEQEQAMEKESRKV